MATLKDEVNALRTLEKDLEHKVVKIDGKALVSEHVSTLDCLEQYGRRASLHVIKNDLEHPNGALDFDKTYRICPIYETTHGKTQDVIIRLKSHSACYAIYNKRKTYKNKKICITPSLTIEEENSSLKHKGSTKNIQLLTLFILTLMMT